MPCRPTLAALRKPPRKSMAIYSAPSIPMAPWTSLSSKSSAPRSPLPSLSDIRPSLWTIASIRTRISGLFLCRRQNSRLQQHSGELPRVCYNETCRDRQSVAVSLSFGEWLSLVEHLVRDQGGGGSNPL